MTTEAPIIPPPHVAARKGAQNHRSDCECPFCAKRAPEDRAMQAKVERDVEAEYRRKPPHPFAALTPGRVVHYVMPRSGECRGASVMYVHRVKGRLVEVGEKEDDEGNMVPDTRQSYTLPDRGTCALYVDVHPSFDIDDVYPDRAEAGRWLREGVVYAPGTQFQEDATPGTWHWAKSCSSG